MKITKEQLEIQKQRVMSRFDFETVHKVMTAIGWKWGAPGSDYLPSVNQLKETALHLIGELPSCGSITTGGFTASLISGAGVDEPYVHLEFTPRYADGEYAD